MSTLTTCLLGWAAFAPVLAPVPPEPKPDPLAKGYVGITVASGELVIADVQPGLPAAKAGVRPGDKIVRVGNLRPHEFGQVVATICSYRPGALIEFEVERAVEGKTERKTFHIKLATRPPELDLPRGGVPIPVFPDR